MRFVAAVLGVMGSIPPLLFFGIGAQTFVRPPERALAIGVTIVSIVLLLLSLTLFFVPAVQRFQAAMLLFVAVIVAIAFATAGR